MATQIDISDPRTMKAYRLALGAKGWIKCRSLLTGRPLAFGVPSASQPGVYHLVTLKTCTCKAFEYQGDCYHRKAVRIHVDRCKAARVAA